MATAEEYAAWIIKNRDKKGTPQFETVKAAYGDLMGKQYAAEIKPATDGMSAIEKGLAGAGKAFVDTARGIGQYVGAVSREDVADARKNDKALMDTTAGTVGNIAGHIAMAVPTVAIPGAASLKGAAAIGAAQGLIQPSTSGTETLTNAGMGGAAGAGGVAAVRAVKGLAGAGRALVEPFSEPGRERIAGRMLQRFAADPSRIAGTNGAPTTTGALPTLAERTGDEGIARLQDSLRSVDPQINSMIGQRLGDNTAARSMALSSLAGTSTTRKAAEEARGDASKHLYQQATSALYKVDDQLAELLNRPAVKQAVERAKKLAANQGRAFEFDVTPGAPFSGVGVQVPGSRQVTGQGLQDLKMAMDEMLSDPASGFTGAAGSTIKNLRGKILDWMEQANPDFKAARTSYAEASKPLNAMDIGEHISRKATANLSDLAGNPKLHANSLAGMLRDEPKLIEQATGRKGLGDSLANILNPDQMATLRAVAAETERAAAVATAGNGPGSATTQRMASQNILRQMVGPTGLPASWAESAIANTAIGKPFNLIYGGVAEPKIQQKLAQAVLDPETAKAVLAAAERAGPGTPTHSALMQILQHAARVAPGAVAATQTWRLSDMAGGQR